MFEKKGLLSGLANLSQRQGFAFREQGFAFMKWAAAFRKQAFAFKQQAAAFRKQIFAFKQQAAAFRKQAFGFFTSDILISQLSAIKYRIICSQGLLFPRNSLICQLRQNGSWIITIFRSQSTRNVIFFHRLNWVAVTKCLVIVTNCQGSLRTKKLQ